MTAIKLATKD